MLLMLKHSQQHWKQGNYQLVPCCTDKSTQGWEEGAENESYMVVLKAPCSTQVPACALLRDGAEAQAGRRSIS